MSDLGLVIAALFYGRAGSGKTTLSSTFPKPILHLDVREKGTDSISDVKGVDTISVESWDDFEAIYWYLASKEHEYKTVVVDAVSQLQDYAVEQAMKDENKSESDIVSKRQWGQAAGKMKSWLISYRDLIDEGINVIFLAHDRTTDGEEGEDGELTPSVGPRVMPSVASILTGSVKVIGNTFIRELHEKQANGKMNRRVVYSMRLGPHAYYNTKVRQPKGSYTPDIIEDPNYEKLVQVMKGDYPRPEPVKAPAKLIRKK